VNYEEKRNSKSAYHSEQVYPEVRCPLFINLLGTFFVGEPVTVAAVSVSLAKIISKKNMET